MARTGRFVGCFVGSVIGDALGAHFEGSWETPTLEVVQKHTRHYLERRHPQLPYTDDTAMAKVVAESLIRCKDFDASDMARRFCDEYYGDKGRGYGFNVVTVFERWKLGSAEERPFEPAKLQFGGEGSEGNGAAMRIAPIAIFAYNDWGKAAEIASGCARLTHSHPNGITGALLQCRAVFQALHANQDESQFANAFIDDLKKFVLQESPGSVYDEKLDNARKLLHENAPPSARDVADNLGNGVRAKNSVVTAIYAFLHACKWSMNFRDMIEFAISIGGDTDTIACMAGAIGGGFWGIEKIPKMWQENVEAVDIVSEMAEQLSDMRST